jgi:hypothetical protein
LSDKNNNLSFRDVVRGLERGDFSRLAPLFDESPSVNGQCPIVAWYKQGYFDAEPKALAEAFTCACFKVEPGSPSFF